MSFHVHRAERADLLARRLGAVLSEPLADPFATEIVAVPTQGVERWLAQNLSSQLGTSVDGGDGVCAGVDFPSLRRVSAEAVAAATGVTADEDPWRPRRAVWPLLDVIDASLGEPWAELLASYLRGPRHPADSDEAQSAGLVRGRRWWTAQHLAELFASYADSRPQMLLAWLEGRDVGSSGRALSSDYAWQPELWRRLRAALGTASSAERSGPAVRRLIDEPELSTLPARLSAFGVTRMSGEQVAVLSALAVHRDVHLWLPHPSPALWRQLSDLPATERVPGPRKADRTVRVPVNPLLGYLGGDIRELQLTLAATQTQMVDHHEQPPNAARAAPATLLHSLQADLAGDAPVRPVPERPALDVLDRSVTLHACHGPDRQVEVLRDLLVGMLADDPTLQPRDIVVMCPDIERFAPLISASFGLWGEEDETGHPGHRLRVRLADRALRQVNPLMAVLSRVLDLADSRVEASRLLDLCACGPVSRRFRFSEDDLDRLGDLVVRSGVRWGLDADHRRQFAMGQFGQNTWTAGLDRLLLGVAMDEGEQQFLGTTLPLDDVDSSDVDLVGRLAELVDRVRALLAELDRPRPIGAWVQLCREILDQLTAVDSGEQWQVAHAYAELGLLTTLDGEQPQAALSVADLQALLADTLRGRATRANFRTGTLTMCTLLPMRSVPHRVICLLGLDDGTYPRSSYRDGDDILAADPWVGDRDPRGEDRQLLLDAVMAAQERLVVIYSGVDARSGALRPPAVPVGALLDALDRTANAPQGRVRDHILARHALQPFDQANFVPGALKGVPSALSFDHNSLRGALAAAGERRPAAVGPQVVRLEPQPLPQIVALADLVRFYQHPVRALLRSRAGLWSGSASDAGASEQIPVQLGPLESWGVGDRLLRSYLDGNDLDQLIAAEWRRGVLPPQGLGSRVLSHVVDDVQRMVADSSQYLTEPRSDIDVLAELPSCADRSESALSSCTVAGTLVDVRGEQLVTVNFSRLGARHRLQAWLSLLALTVSHPERAWRAVSVGRGGTSVLGPVPAPWAERVLADLVELYRTGLNEPLPLAPKPACEYARLRDEGKAIEVYLSKLEKLWQEDRDLSYERIFGAGVRFGEVLQIPRVPGEERGSLAEPSRFGTLARRVWHPLLEAESA